MYARGEARERQRKKREREMWRMRRDRNRNETRESLEDVLQRFLLPLFCVAKRTTFWNYFPFTVAWAHIKTSLSSSFHFLHINFQCCNSISYEECKEKRRILSQSKSICKETATTAPAISAEMHRVNFYTSSSIDFPICDVACVIHRMREKVSSALFQKPDKNVDKRL